MNLNDPIIVYTLTDSIRAQLISNILRSEGISCFLGGIHQASTAGLPGTIIQVNVAAEDAGRARKIIEGLEKTKTSA